MFRLCVAMALGVTVLATAPTRADDLKDMVGQWKISKAILGGNDITATLGSAKMTIDAQGKYSTVLGGETDKGRFTLDEKATPRGMDITSESEGPLKGVKILAIYELKGDTLQVCYDLDMKNRPGKFEAPAKTNVLLVQYQRESK